MFVRFFCILTGEHLFVNTFVENMFGNFVRNICLLFDMEYGMIRTDYD